MTTRTTLERWVAPKSPDEPILDSLDRLESALDPLFDAFEWGPVPGAYFPIKFRGHEAAGLSAPVNYDQFSIGWPGIPIYIGGGCDVGQVTFQIFTGASNLLTTPLTVSAGVGGQYNRRQDFLSDLFPNAPLTLRVTFVNGGPSWVSVLLVCKNIGKIEPA